MIQKSHLCSALSGLVLAIISTNVSANSSTNASANASANASTSVVASVLPSSRSISVGETATVFASVINAGSNSASSCTVSLASEGLPISLAFSPTNTTTNAVRAPAQTAVDIPANATATFLLSITATAAFDPANVEFLFDCENAQQAPTTIGVNTLLLSVSDEPTADLITLIATPSSDGVMRVGNALGSQILAMATSNVGDADTLVLTAESGSTDVPAQFLVCETDSMTGDCLSPQAPAVSLQVAAGATPTFAVFAQADGGAEFAPASNRVFVKFRDPAGAVRGSSSVAYTAPTPDSFTNSPGGLWHGFAVEDGESTPVIFAISEAGELRYLSAAGSLGRVGVSWNETQFGGVGDAFAPRGFVWSATGTRSASLSLQGNYITRSSITANFFLGDRVRGDLSLEYHPSYDQDSATRRLEGQWTIRDYVDGTDIGDIQVAQSGHLSGQDGFGCDYNGLISIINSEFNLYRVSAQLTNCGANNGFYTGLGTLSSVNASNDTFIYALNSPDNAIVNSITRF